METHEVERPSLSGLFRIALPMIVSHASETMMMFVDRLFLSWLSPTHIAAAMAGGLSAFVFSSLFAGTVGYTNAIVAQYFGARRHERCVSAVSQGLILSVVLTPLLFALIPLVQRTFVWAGHSANQIELEFSYFRVLMFGSWMILLRQVFVGYFLGIGRTRIVMIANLVGMAVNIPLNYLLIFGLAGFPALGIVGAAYGTIGGSLTILAILAVVYARHPIVRANRNAARLRFDRDVFTRLVRFGAPAGVELFLNVFAFNTFVQLFHSMGEEVAAAVTITFNYDMVAFIPMLGLGIAVTAMVGQQVGAGRPEDAKRATYLALRVGYSYAAIMMAIFLFGAPSLVRLFIAGADGDGGTLQALAQMMIRMAAIYTLADITQLIFAGALRGAGDTRAVMILSVVVHWLMAIAAVLLIRVFRLAPLEVWGFFIGFVLLLGIVMFVRFRSNRWIGTSLVDDTVITHETHPPEIATEGKWM
jgi:MATE family multidrug resistance protein